MKRLVLAGALAALGFAQGCGHAPEKINPSASYPDFGTGVAQETARQGELVVEIDPQPELPATADRELYPDATNVPSYTIYDEDGKRIHGIRGRSVHLPSGRYLIRIDEGKHEEEVFWVTIRPDQQTVVDLRKAGEHHRRLEAK